MKSHRYDLTEAEPAELFGLAAWLDRTRVRLPLKGIECRFDVEGDTAAVELDQIYHQDNTRPLDCVYTFPLPDGAAVHRCEMHVNGRVIAARVEELEAAREIARREREAGHRTALMESVRGNLFELALGNLAPGDVVVIRLAYVQTLRRLGGSVSLRIPFCPGIRYVAGRPLLRSNLGRGSADDTDQVPDASRLSPPRIDSLHPDAAYFAIEGRISPAPDEAVPVASPSHTLMIRPADGGAAVRLADGSAVPDRDFVVRWRETAGEAPVPCGWFSRGNDGTFAVVRVVAPVETKDASDYAQDVYFLLDRSGSMNGEKWNACCRAFREFLGRLAPQDRAWVTFFESQFQDLAEKPLPPGAVLAESFVRNLEQFGVAGGTELLPALEHLVSMIDRHSKRRDAVIVLVTDGQVGNEKAVLECLRARPDVRVHTFGIDTVVNDHLLERLSAQNRGFCHLVTPNDDIAGAISSLGARLRQPVLRSLAAPQGWEFAGGPPPDLFAGDALTVALKGTAIPAETATITLTARRPDGTRHDLPVRIESAMRETPRLIWTRARIDHLIASGKNAEAIALAKSANLLCEGTAFVAWDEAEKIAVAGPRIDIYQAAMEPADWCAMLSAAPAVKYSLADHAAAAPPLTIARRRASKSRGGRTLHQSFGFLSDHFESAPPPAAPGPPVAMGPPDWKIRFGKIDALVATDAGRRLIDWLEQWSLASPDQRETRERELEKLALQVSASPSWPESLRRLEAGVRGLFQTHRAFLRPCLELIAEMKSGSTVG